MHLQLHVAQLEPEMFESHSRCWFHSNGTKHWRLPSLDVTPSVFGKKTRPGGLGFRRPFITARTRLARSDRIVTDEKRRPDKTD